MKHEHLAEGVDLYLGDSLKVLGKVPQASHMIFDPPYEQHMHRAKAGARGVKPSRKLRTDGHPEAKPVNFASIDTIRERVTRMAVSGCDGWLIAFCTPEGIAPWRDAIEEAGGRYKRACFWTKLGCAPQFNGQGPAMGVECLVTAWCGTGVSRWNGGGRWNVFEHAIRDATRHGEHETEKPLSLMMELVHLFTNPGDLIVDPFMGSGTTGMACVKLGRKFAGIEKDRKYFAIARQRIAETLRQTDLFLTIPTPVAKLKGFA